MGEEMGKIVSQLDADGFLVGPVTADESPLEPGVYLIPGGAIDKASPTTIAVGKRYWVVNGKWVSEDIPAAPEYPPAADA